MSRKIIQEVDLMRETEALLLKHGYGGFNFSVLSTSLGVARSTLYEYYASKDDLIVAYMNKLMVDYIDELTTIVACDDAKGQLFQLIELMVKYAHIHTILKMIPLLRKDSEAVIEMKERFITDHVRIIQQIQMIIDHGKEKNVVRKEIPTDVLVNLLFNTINKPTSLKMDNNTWAKWIWEIIYTGMGVGN